MGRGVILALNRLRQAHSMASRPAVNDLRYDAGRVLTSNLSVARSKGDIGIVRFDNVVRIVGQSTDLPNGYRIVLDGDTVGRTTQKICASLGRAALFTAQYAHGPHH